MPTFPPLHSSLVGFGELSITASQVVKTPLTGSQSAGVWGVAATDTEMTALKSAGPKQTAGVVAYGGSTSAAIAAEISPNNTTGQVVSVLAQGQQTGLKAQSDSGPAVYGVSGTGMAIYGTSTGGWAGYFVGKVSCSSDLVVNGALTTASLTVNGVAISDQSAQIAALGAQIAALEKSVQNLEGLPDVVNGLRGQIDDLQNAVAVLQGQVARG
jgi:hypothetical protein